MAPMYQAARINSKSLVLKAAAGIAEESDKIKQAKAALLMQLKNCNKRLEEIDREVAKCINRGKQVDMSLARSRREYKDLKYNLARQLKGLR